MAMETVRFSNAEVTMRLVIACVFIVLGAGLVGVVVATAPDESPQVIAHDVAPHTGSQVRGMVRGLPFIIIGLVGVAYAVLSPLLMIRGIDCGDRLTVRRLLCATHHDWADVVGAGCDEWRPFIKLDDVRRRRFALWLRNGKTFEFPIARKDEGPLLAVLWERAPYVEHVLPDSAPPPAARSNDPSFPR